MDLFDKQVFKSLIVSTSTLQQIMFKLKILNTTAFEATTDTVQDRVKDAKGSSYRMLADIDKMVFSIKTEKKDEKS